LSGAEKTAALSSGAEKTRRYLHAALPRSTTRVDYSLRKLAK